MFYKKCQCTVEHVLIFHRRRWHRLSRINFDIDGAAWTALFDDNPTRTIFSLDESVGAGFRDVKYEFEGIVEPGRCEQIIAFA